jgi:hypothetical protein
LAVRPSRRKSKKRGKREDRPFGTRKREEKNILKPSSALAAKTWKRKTALLGRRKKRPVYERRELNMKKPHFQDKKEDHSAAAKK